MNQLDNDEAVDKDQTKRVFVTSMDKDKATFARENSYPFESVDIGSEENMDR